jgi:hypothetical protein
MGWSGLLGHGEGVLIKHYMAQYEDTIGLKVEAAVSFMVGGITKKDAQGGSRCKFVGGCGREVRIASAAKNTKMVVLGLDTKQDRVRCGGVKGFGGEDVENMCGNM